MPIPKQYYNSFVYAQYAAELYAKAMRKVPVEREEDPVVIAARNNADYGDHYIYQESEKKAMEFIAKELKRSVQGINLLDGISLQTIFLAINKPFNPDNWVHSFEELAESMPIDAGLASPGLARKFWTDAMKEERKVAATKNAHKEVVTQLLLTVLQECYEEQQQTQVALVGELMRNCTQYLTSLPTDERPLVENNLNFKYPNKTLAVRAIRAALGRDEHSIATRLRDAHSVFQANEAVIRRQERSASVRSMLVLCGLIVGFIPGLILGYRYCGDDSGMRWFKPMARIALAPERAVDLTLLNWEFTRTTSILH